MVCSLIKTISVSLYKYLCQFNVQYLIGNKIVSYTVSLQKVEMFMTIGYNESTIP